MTGLILAASNGHEAVVLLLLERGAEVDKASKVGVMCASISCYIYSKVGVKCPSARPWHPSLPANGCAPRHAARKGTRGRAGERAGA